MEWTNTVSRRNLLGGAAIMAGGALSACATTSLKPGTGTDAGFFARHDLPLGMQLYTVSDAAEKDLDGTFTRLAAIGYRTIELAGYHGKTPQDLRAAADRAGLRLAGCHVPFKGVPSRSGPSLDGDISKVAADLHVLGISQIAAPIFLIPDRIGLAPGEDFLAYLIRVGTMLTADDWKRAADVLNEKSKALAREGIALGYHNHNCEFAPVGGTTGYEILIRETDPAVFFEMDAGWVAAAGLDPLELLARHSGRFRMMHVKDILASTKPNYVLKQDPTEVGRGMIPWPKLLPAAYAAGVRSFFVEQEPPFTMDRFDSLKVSRDYLVTI